MASKRKRKATVLTRKPAQPPKPGVYFWTPYEDISLYELAHCLGVLISSIRGLTPTQLDAMVKGIPPRARRHFSIRLDK